MRGDLPHVVRQPAAGLIADERIAVVVVAGADDNLIEARSGGQRKYRLLQPPIAVITAKVEAVGKLVRAQRTRALPVAALHTDARINLEAGIIRRVNQFRRDGLLPSDAVGGGVVIVRRRIVRDEKIVLTPAAPAHAEDAVAPDHVADRRD